MILANILYNLKAKWSDVFLQLHLSKQKNFTSAVLVALNMVQNKLSEKWFYCQKTKCRLYIFQQTELTLVCFIVHF